MRLLAILARAAPMAAGSTPDGSALPSDGFGWGCGVWFDPLCAAAAAAVVAASDCFDGGVVQGGTFAGATEPSPAMSVGSPDGSAESAYRFAARLFGQVL